MIDLLARRDAPYRRSLVLLVVAMSTLLIAGCQGCRDDAEQTAEQERLEEEAREEREKPTYETEPAVVFPGQYANVLQKNRTKRGHWVTADFRVVANKFDLQGELAATSYTSGGLGKPVVIESTDYYAVSARPFSIPQGELRNLETSLYIPRRDANPAASINFSMSRSAGGPPQFSSVHPTRTMHPFQYHIVLLSNRPDSYQYLDLIDSVRVPAANDFGGNVPEFYTVVRNQSAKEPITLPRHALNWTTIAYLIWDDLQVDQLDVDQQQALIDWIHFGGQLIISGPDCLDQLSDCFLTEYLPAESAGADNLDSEAFAALNQNWALKIPQQDRRQELQVATTEPILGVKFKPHPKGQFMPKTGRVAIERQIGRGRIVVTAFSLNSKPIIRWSGFRNFFNGGLLRRPGRKFGETVDGTLTFAWLNDDTSIFDPLIGSKLRYLSRDLVNRPTAATPGTPVDPAIKPGQLSNAAEGMNFRYRPRFASQPERRNLWNHWHYGGFQHDDQSGTAGWNDNSGISATARDILREAAGISPPSSDFVLRMLVVYLIVLVPVNWLVFRLMGRVEWAWIAAPVIAVVGAVMVARMASLDIGFVRSNSQVGIVEVFADYRRAHVAQYSALYTSLSTGYDIELDNPTAQALPLGQPGRGNQQRTILPVVFRQTIANRLENLQVDSNSTGMLHTEMMFDLQGVFSLDDSGEQRVENSSSLNLTDAAVMRRTSGGQLQTAWIGTFPGNSLSPPLKFVDTDNLLAAWQQSDILATERQVLEYWALLLDSEAGDAESRFTATAMQQLLPDINEKWSQFVALLRRRFPDREFDTLLNLPVDFSTFRDLVVELNSDDQVNVSPMLATVFANLQLAAGEMRLMAVTDQAIGSQAFVPASTQSRQQSLVVVHLNRPALPDTTPDDNSTDEFLGGLTDLGEGVEVIEFDGSE